METGLKNRVAVVAASSQGIGRATAEAFAAEGCKVAMCARNAEALEAAAAQIRGKYKAEVFASAVDVTNEAAVQSFVKSVAGKFGSVDICVTNAGGPPAKRFLAATVEEWRQALDANLLSAVYFAREVIPHMQKRKAGSIACMSSVSAQRGGGIFGGPHYSAAKAGVLGLAKAMAREFGADGIRVNCVTPGLIGTDITSGKLTEEMRTRILEGIPLGRLGEAKDVAGIYTFLASDLSAYVTGAVIDVNGGMLIH